jgi:transposase
MKKNASSYNLTSRSSLDGLSKEELVDAVLLLGAKVQQLSDTVRDLISSKYGRKTERFDSPDQLNLFPKPGDHTDANKPENKESKVKKPQEGHGRNPYPSGMVRKRTFAKLSADQANCNCCGVALEATRVVHQGSRLQYTPAVFEIEDMTAVAFCCPQCKQNEVIARVTEPVENGIAAPSLLAQVAVAKGQDHMPFNRQSAIYARSGINLHRSTLADMFAQTASILRPLYDLMYSELLKSKVIWTDDTPVKVKDNTKDKNIKTGRLWIYMGDDEHPFSLFDYTTGRGRDGPLTFLAEFDGFLQGDCFSGNLAVCAANGTILVACLAHARRYFIKALLNDKDGCERALTMFQCLFEIERTARDLHLEAPAVKKMREEESMPILTEFHSWLKEQYKFAQPKSTFGKALFYCLNNWTELNQYVLDGSLSIDNNCSEREMKYIAMGRKAWLFLGSDRGGKNHAIVLSLLATCRRHGIEPWAYLTDVIERLSEKGKKNLEDLLPHRWKPRMKDSAAIEIPPVLLTPKVQNLSALSQKDDQRTVLRNAI